MRRINIITGHYGSGKSNLSVNLALEAAKEGGRVTVVDLDIVNPYFRTADFRSLFDERGIELVAPSYANTNLDIPALCFDLERMAADNDNTLIIDVGGDDDGAVALGRFSQSLNCYIDEPQQLDMLYVFNRYRYMTGTPQEAAELLYKIEAASSMRHTALVNNSNLGYETNRETVESSLAYAQELSELVHLPVVFNTAPKSLSLGDDRFRDVEIYVRPIWER